VDPVNPTASEVDNAIQRNLTREQELLSADDEPEDGNGTDRRDDAGIPEQPDIQGSLFIQEDGTVNVSNPLEIFGRSGGEETVLIEPDVGNVELDANVERVDLPSSFASYSFEVTDAGLRIAVNGDKVFSLPSANQEMELRFADGSATLRQTGAATFELENATIRDQDVQPDIELDDDEISMTALSGTTANLTEEDGFG
jgi:hypothetical protein